MQERYAIPTASRVEYHQFRPNERLRQDLTRFSAAGQSAPDCTIDSPRTLALDRQRYRSSQYDLEIASATKAFVRAARFENEAGIPIRSLNVKVLSKEALGLFFGVRTEELHQATDDLFSMEVYPQGEDSWDLQRPSETTELMLAVSAKSIHLPRTVLYEVLSDMHRIAKTKPGAYRLLPHAIVGEDRPMV